MTLSHAYRWIPGPLVTLLFPLAMLGQFIGGSVVVYEQTGIGQQFQDGYLIRLREFSPSGTPGMVVDLPTTGPNAILGDNSNYGHSLYRTPDGAVVVLSGYATYSPAWTFYSSMSSASIPRVVGHVDASGLFTTTYTTATQLNTTVESATSDGVGYWVSGANGHIVYMGPGPQAVVTSVNGHVGQMAVDNDQLSISVIDGTTPSGLYDVGSGEPTTAGHGVVSLFASTTGSGFTFNADRTICYKVAGNALQKWTNDGATWSLAYALPQTAATTLRQVCVDWTGTEPAIYATASGPNSLLRWVDNGGASPGTMIAQSSGAPWYGISMVPGSCTIGAPCNDDNPNSANDVVGPGCVCSGQAQQLALKAALQGPYVSSTGLMSDDLRSLSNFPLSEPYSAQGLAPANAGATVSPSVLAVPGNNAVVDWMLVEVRAAGTPTNVLWRHACLLQRDGDIVQVDGLTSLPLPFADGSYYVAVRHRNHLGAMTAAPVPMSGNVVIDFSDPDLPTYGTDARSVPGTKALLWQGNVFPDKFLKYTGTSNDRDLILTHLGGSLPTNTIAGYYRSDTNLDGVVKYTGFNNDRDPVLINVGGSVPTNTRTEQIP